MHYFRIFFFVIHNISLHLSNIHYYFIFLKEVTFIYYYLTIQIRRATTVVNVFFIIVPLVGLWSVSLIFVRARKSIWTLWLIFFFFFNFLLIKFLFVEKKITWIPKISEGVSIKKKNKAKKEQNDDGKNKIKKTRSSGK